MTFSTTKTTVDLAELLMDSDHPRQAASRTLGYIRDHMRARSVSLWSIDPNEELVLELGLDMDSETLKGAATLWGTRNGGDDMLRSEDAVMLCAVGAPDAWAYVDGINPAIADTSQLGSGAGVAIKVLRRGRAGGGILAAARDVKREELIAVLNLHEWNIARVARVKGVTRKTIYEWLGRYKIERARVPK